MKSSTFYCALLVEKYATLKALATKLGLPYCKSKVGYADLLFQRRDEVMKHHFWPMFNAFAAEVANTGRTEKLYVPVEHEPAAASIAGMTSLEAMAKAQEELNEEANMAYLAECFLYNGYRNAVLFTKGLTLVDNGGYFIVTRHRIAA